MVLLIESPRLCAPVRGKIALLPDELPGPPLNPSHDPTKGGPSKVMGSSKPGLESRLAANVEVVSDKSSAAESASGFMPPTLSPCLVCVNLPQPGNLRI